MRRGASGFTLVEVLVALTLLAAVSATLAGTIGFAGRGWSAASARSTGRDDAAAAQAFLRARLGEIATTGDGGEGADIGGGPDRLDFVAWWEPGGAPGGLHRFALGLGADGLALAWEREDGGGGGGRRVLAPGATALRVAFFGAAEPGAAPGWSARWRPEDGAPALLRIEAGFADPARAWPPLTVRRGP